MGSFLVEGPFFKEIFLILKGISMGQKDAPTGIDGSRK
jgi:hypothetical protein